MRTPLIAGNWKMFKTITETMTHVKVLRPLVKDMTDVEIVVAPPFPAIHPAAESLRGSNVLVAAQNLYWEREGAFTGEVSGPMLKEAGVEVKVGQFPFSANGRAMTLQGEDGFVRVVARADNHVVLGIQAVGSGVSELSAAFALAIEMGARLEDIAGTIHAHPTQSEGFLEASLKALGHALHI